MDRDLAELLREIEAAGLRLECDGERLRLGPPPVPPELVERVRAHKAQLLLFLSPPGHGEKTRIRDENQRRDAENGILTTVSLSRTTENVRRTPDAEFSDSRDAPTSETTVRNEKSSSARENRSLSLVFSREPGGTGEKTCTTQRTADPRADDLPEDSLFWRDLLARADAYDGHDARGLFGALHGMRCLGARLERRPDGGYRLVPGEIPDGDYRRLRVEWLLPHRETLVRLLAGEAVPPKGDRPPRGPRPEGDADDADGRCADARARDGTGDAALVAALRARLGELAPVHAGRLAEEIGVSFDEIQPVLQALLERGEIVAVHGERRIMRHSVLTLPAHRGVAA
jgi:hypothetical protein